MQGAIALKSSVTVACMHQVQVGDHLISVDDTPIGLSHGAPSNTRSHCTICSPLSERNSQYLYVIFVYDKHDMPLSRSQTCSPSVLLQGRVRGLASTWLTLHLRGFHTHTRTHAHTHAHTHTHKHVARPPKGLLFSPARALSLKHTHLHT